MTDLFSALSNRPKQEPAADDQARLDRAYERGWLQERAGLAERAARKENDPALRRAYERGRRDERARRRGSPLVTFVLLLAAAAGASALYLAIREGSFAGGGQVVDQNIANATATASHATQGAANKAGDALQDAGSRLKRSAGQS